MKINFWVLYIANSRRDSTFESTIILLDLSIATGLSISANVNSLVLASGLVLATICCCEFASLSLSIQSYCWLCPVLLPLVHSEQMGFDSA